MSDDRGPTALVTGASSGIGRELARRFARDGFDLVLVARSGDDLRAMAEAFEADHGVRSLVVERDLATEDGPAAVYEATESADVEVDVLVNNAGWGPHGEFVEGDLEDQLSAVRLNVLAPTHLAGLYLPDMVERGVGGVLNVASTAAFQPGPGMAVYYATKAYVLSFTEAIAEELAGTDVTVTTLCPGPTDTGFQDRAEMEEARLAADPLLMDPEEVAAAGYRGLREGDRVVVPGVANRAHVQGTRLLPRSATAKIAGWINERS